jgi:hypothetical protein
VYSINSLNIKKLGNFSAIVSRKDTLKPTIENESLHEISNDIGVRAVNLPYPKSELKARCSYIAPSINIFGHLQILAIF